MANKPINEYFSGLPKNSSPSSTTNLVVEENGVAKKVPIGSLPSGGSSGGGISILDVTELPSTLNLQAIYRVTADEVVSVEVVSGGVQTGQMAEIVYELPEVGEPFMDMTTYLPYPYYCLTDGNLYGYITEELKDMMGAPSTGWMTEMFEGMPIVHSIEDAPAESDCWLITQKAKTRVYIANPDGTCLELTSGIRTMFDSVSGNATIIEA